MAHAPEHILISRTDSIGDVMLTLPMVGLLKRAYPEARIGFLGRSYTLPILQRCSHLEEAFTLDALRERKELGAIHRLRELKVHVIVHVFPEPDVARWAKAASIPVRIGTSRRLFHWFSCNERVSFSRKKSDLHEAQLNAKLLAPLGITEIPTLEELATLYGFTAPAADAHTSAFLRPGKRQVILHPGSRGSAVEWGLPNFAQLMRALDPSRFHCIVTGTEAEAEGYRAALPLDLPHVVDAGGQLSLEQMIGLIGASDALVAASTGPLHIAAALGKRAIGLYSARRPIHPGRWAPIGTDAHALVFDVNCERCASGRNCDCITRIPVERIVTLLER